MNICTKIRIKNYLLDNVLRSTIPFRWFFSDFFNWFYTPAEENVFDDFENNYYFQLN